MTVGLWTVSAATLPSIVTAGEAVRSVAELTAWAGRHRDELIATLHRSGAVLFRGCSFDGADAFQRFARLFCDQLDDYVGGNSPRARVSGGVFTTTQYSAAERISLHNEASYLRRMPRRILFCCEIPPSDRGQTPLADSRRVLERIRPDVRQEFAARRVKYINNLHDGRGVLGRSWPAAFQTDDKAEVERRLIADGYTYEWKSDGGLRTSIVADATATHPQTGEEAWINQAEQWHPSSLNRATYAALAALLPAADFPHHATFGDGSPLDDADLDHIRAAMTAEERVFQWATGDILLCDNLLVMHGRQPFSGLRRILAAMG